jgi:hypothetical protein
VSRLRVGITAVLTCFAALALVPSAFAHHGRITGSMNCEGVVSFTASAWQTTSVLARTHNDVRIYVVQANGIAVSPALQAANGQFNSANGFAFSGSFPAPSLVNSLKLNVKEIGPWGNGTASSNGTHPESSTLITRPTTGCVPPPKDECPNLEGIQESVPAGMIKDADGKCVTPPPPPPTDQCPNLEGLQTSVPAGMSKDAGGNCVTPPPPPPPPTDECPNVDGLQTSVPAGMVKDSSGSCFTPPTPGAIPASLPGTVTPASKPAPKAKVTVKKKAKKKVVKKKKAAKKKKAVKKQSTAKKTKPSVLPFTR